MRQIATLSTANHAQRFAAYLITQGIATTTDESGDGWAIWVKDEDQLPNARTALAEFQADPNASKFQGVERAAEEKRRAEAAKREAARKNVVTMGNRWTGPQAGARRRPLTLGILFLCAAIGVITNMGENAESPVYQFLLFRTDDVRSTARDDSVPDKLTNIRRGEIWRVVTPALLHFGPFHLAFNLAMFYQLASVLEQRRGSVRLLLIVLALAIPSNLAQGLAPGTFGGGTHFGGLSGVVFGLFGYFWMKTQFEPESGLYISRGSLLIAVLFLILGIVGAFNIGGVRIANWAHSVGFVAGILLGIAPQAFRSAGK